MQKATVRNQARTNDYLDLLNYAKLIGDPEWQNEIIHELKQSDGQLDAQLQSEIQATLWSQFDIINKQVLELYDLARKSRDNAELLKYEEKLRGLKRQRADVVLQIKGV